MYQILHEILKDQKTETIFSVFGIYHILYIVLILGLIATMLCIFKNKNMEAKQKLIKTTISIAFIMYILDFFLMPFAYGKIDFEKLPFHLCTVSCVLAFISRHNKILEKYKVQFAILGLIGNFIYLIYPGGVGQFQIHPLSYRVVQTLLYHGVMSAYGIFVLCFENVSLKWKNIYKEIVIIALLVIWALIGNCAYNGNVGEYNHYFNWLFVIQDPFYLLPIEIGKYIMPFIVIITFSIAVALVYLIYFIVVKWFKKKPH